MRQSNVAGEPQHAAQPNEDWEESQEAHVHRSQAGAGPLGASKCKPMSVAALWLGVHLEDDILSALQDPSAHGHHCKA